MLISISCDEVYPFYEARDVSGDIGGAFESKYNPYVDLNEDDYKRVIAWQDETTYIQELLQDRYDARRERLIK